MTINSKATLKKPDYRPDLLPKNHSIRNMIFFVMVAFAFSACGFGIWHYKQTKTVETVIKKENTQQLKLANTTISNKNQVFKCTDANGAVIYQNICPSNSKSEVIETYKSSGITAYKPISLTDQIDKKTSISSAIFDREKETCKKRVQEKINNLKKNRSFSKSERELLEVYERELRNCLT